MFYLIEFLFLTSFITCYIMNKLSGGAAMLEIDDQPIAQVPCYEFSALTTTILVNSIYIYNQTQSNPEYQDLLIETISQL